MTPLLRLFTSAFVLAALAVWISGILSYLFLRWFSEYRSHFSSRFWFAAGLFPASVGAIIGLLALASGWLSARHWIPDHCLEHRGHPHLCLTHIGQFAPGGPLFWLIVTVAAVCVGCAVVSISFANSALLKIPNASAEKDGFYIYPNRAPAAFTAGLLSPRPYLSSHAAEQLNSEEKAVILAHEREHILRRDPLRLLILQLLERSVPGGSYIRSQWQSANELECDEAALRKGFSAQLIAETILKLQRATQAYLHAGSTLHYAGQQKGDFLKFRIEALFHDGEKFSVGVKPVLLSLGVLLIVSLAFFGDVHHMLETVLGWLI